MLIVLQVEVGGLDINCITNTSWCSPPGTAVGPKIEFLDI